MRRVAFLAALCGSWVVVVEFTGLNEVSTGAFPFFWALLVGLAFDVVVFCPLLLLVGLPWVILAFFARVGDLVVVTASMLRLAPAAPPLSVGGMVSLLSFSVEI